MKNLILLILFLLAVLSVFAQDLYIKKSTTVGDIEKIESVKLRDERIGIGTSTPTRLLEIMELTPDSFAAIKIVQGSNTGSNSHAFIDHVSVSGDAFDVYGTDQGIDWSVGIDNSDNNKFKISREFGIGVNDKFVIDTAGNIGIGTTNPGEKLEVAGNAKVTGDIYSTAWTDYGGTSTIAGWSGTPTVRIHYKKLGNLVFVNFRISGTSNATNVSFTLPYTSVVISSYYIRVACQGEDNGVWLDNPSLITFEGNSSTVNIAKSFSSGLVMWTSSGEKLVIGQFWYEAQ